MRLKLSYVVALLLCGSGSAYVRASSGAEIYFDRAAAAIAESIDHPPTDTASLPLSPNAALTLWHLRGNSADKALLERVAASIRRTAATQPVGIGRVTSEFQLFQIDFALGRATRADGVKEARAILDSISDKTLKAILAPLIQSGIDSMQDNDTAIDKASAAHNAAALRLLAADAYLNDDAPRLEKAFKAMRDSAGSASPELLAKLGRFEEAEREAAAIKDPDESARQSVNVGRQLLSAQGNTPATWRCMGRISRAENPRVIVETGIRAVRFGQKPIAEAALRAVMKRVGDQERPETIWHAALLAASVNHVEETKHLTEALTAAWKRPTTDPNTDESERHDAPALHELALAGISAAADDLPEMRRHIDASFAAKRLAGYSFFDEPPELLAALATRHRYGEADAVIVKLSTRLDAYTDGYRPLAEAALLEGDFDRAWSYGSRADGVAATSIETQILVKIRATSDAACLGKLDTIRSASDRAVVALRIAARVNGRSAADAMDILDVMPDACGF